jgi:hypothetical protein
MTRGATQADKPLRRSRSRQRWLTFAAVLDTNSRTRCLSWISRDDGELTVEVTAGSAEAFGELSDRYGDRAYRMTLSFCHDDAHPPDAVQEGFPDAQAEVITLSRSAANALTPKSPRCSGSARDGQRPHTGRSPPTPSQP